MAGWRIRGWVQGIGADYSEGSWAYSSQLSTRESAEHDFIFPSRHTSSFFLKKQQFYYFYLLSFRTNVNSTIVTKTRCLASEVCEREEENVIKVRFKLKQCCLCYCFTLLNLCCFTCGLLVRSMHGDGKKYR